MSTRKPIPHHSIVPRKSSKRFDPRFECGEFDAVRFSRDYAFVTDLKQAEIGKLRRALHRGELPDPEAQQQARETIRVMENQVRAAQDQSAEIEARAELRTDNIRRLRAGQKPVFLNRRESNLQLFIIHILGCWCCPLTFFLLKIYIFAICCEKFAAFSRPSS